MTKKPLSIDPPKERDGEAMSRKKKKKRWRMEKMIPQQWASPCNNHCTAKYAALTQIPWRVFCKKGCDADGETWEECLEECNELCYKDPVLKDRQWSAYIDRSPGTDSHSEECFHACTSGCGYKFEIQPDKVDEARPNRPPKVLPIQEQSVPPEKSNPSKPSEEVPGTSA